jgi:uncharacterized membrane protein YphA (DoxX/SURF4 family)
MNADQTNWKSRALDTVAVLARWLLGALFIYMGTSKALHPEQFLKLLRQYEIAQTPLILNSVAAALPWFEAFCGLLLLAGIAVRGSALVVLAMLVPFTLLVLKRALAIHTAQAIPLCAVRFDCGCGSGEVWICGKLAENCLLICLSFWLLAGRGRQFCARHSLMRVA